MLAGLAARAMRALRDACRPSGVASGFIADLTRSRAELVAENVLLRQQLIVASRAVKRPALRTHERGLIVLLASFLPQWRQALLVLKPETVLRWHREGFRWFWRRARVVRTAVRAPLMNAVCERFLGSVRRECLDHVIILSERHLRHVLGEYALSYFNGARPHQGIGQRIPTLTERPQARLACSVDAIPVLGGLHHDYRAAA
jgi:hypothetical protein